MTDATDDFVDLDLPDDLDAPPAASADPPAKTGEAKTPGKRFSTGLPGPGRPKRLAAFVRWQTDQGRELVKIMWRIARGKKFKLSRVTLLGEVVEVRVRPPIRDRMEAVQWLADRGFGKVKDTLKLEEESGRRPVNIVLLGGPSPDPLTQEPPRRILPQPPAIAEVEFDLQDVELPPNEGR